MVEEPQIENSDMKDGNDQFECLTTYNAFVKYYSEQLKNAIEILRQENLDVKITYFDYYGFSLGKIETFKACCGKGEPYNLIAQIACGSLVATFCSEPSKHINWNKPYFTETACTFIAKGLIEIPFANPSLKFPPFKIA
ncbi:GDSL esterase/lipase [Glycine soja]